MRDKDFLFFLEESGEGGVAQLGERLNGIQKVRGSSPLVSIVIIS